MPRQVTMTTFLPVQASEGLKATKKEEIIKNIFAPGELFDSHPFKILES